MYLLMEHAAGVMVEAMILARSKNRMRVVVPGFPDTMELRRSGSQWLTEDRQPVVLSFLMPLESRSEAVNGSIAARAAGHATD